MKARLVKMEARTEEITKSKICRDKEIKNKKEKLKDKEGKCKSSNTGPTRVPGGKKF